MYDTSKPQPCPLSRQTATLSPLPRDSACALSAFSFFLFFFSSFFSLVHYQVFSFLFPFRSVPFFFLFLFLYAVLCACTFFLFSFWAYIVCMHTTINTMDMFPAGIFWWRDGTPQLVSTATMNTVCSLAYWYDTYCGSPTHIYYFVPGT